MKSELRITKEIFLKDNRKVLINIREDKTRLKIYGYNGSNSHIVIFLEDLNDFLPLINKEVEEIKAKTRL